MNKPVQLVLLTMLVISASFSQTPPPGTERKVEVRGEGDVAEAIIAREEGFWDAWKNRRADFFKENLTEESVVVIGTGRKGKSQVVEEIPHHSTFSKNRHGRFQESKLFEQLFEQIVRQCVEVGLVQGTHLSVDGSFVEANAAKESRVPRERLAEATQVSHTVRQYLVELEEQNPVEEPVHEQEQVSTT